MCSTRINFAHTKRVIFARADPEQCCWGGCELDGAKRRRASATEAARSPAEGAAAGVWGAKIGLLES